MLTVYTIYFQTRQLIDPNMYWFSIPSIGPVLKGLTQVCVFFFFVQWCLLILMLASVACGMHSFMHVYR